MGNLKKLNNDKKWELFETHRSKLYEQHICVIVRRGDGRGICEACIIESWLKELDEGIKEHE